MLNSQKNKKPNKVVKLFKNLKINIEDRVIQNAYIKEFNQVCWNQSPHCDFRILVNWKHIKLIHNQVDKKHQVTHKKIYYHQEILL